MPPPDPGPTPPMHLVRVLDYIAVEAQVTKLLDDYPDYHLESITPVLLPTHPQLIIVMHHEDHDKKNP